MKFIYDNIMYAELNTKSRLLPVHVDIMGRYRLVTDDKNGKLVWECPKLWQP